MADHEDRGSASADDGRWERELLSRLAFASLKEQRRARRWRVFFGLAILLYLFLVFFTSVRGLGEGIVAGRHTALVELRGVIAPNSRASADNIVTGLRSAFKHKDAVGVILRINSPGGSPVQSSYIYDEIKRLREKYPDKRLYAVVSDICASGGYYAAVAADEIYANRASIVGSIGVLMNGFGFTHAMEKLGIERRLLTAGEHKDIMDPFSPVEPEEREHMQRMLDEVHRQFIQAVKEGRGERLSDNPDIFSGLFWTGEEGMRLGLIDGLGSASYVAREVIGAEKVVDYTPQPDLFERLSSGVGAAMARALENLDAAPDGLGEPKMR